MFISLSRKKFVFFLITATFRKYLFLQSIMIKVRKVEEGIYVSLFQLNKINTLFSGLLLEQLKELVEVSGDKIFFDLSEIKFIDSSGFEMLKRVNDISVLNSSEFILCNISQEVEELFNLMTLNGTFKTCKKELATEPLMLEVE